MTTQRAPSKIIPRAFPGIKLPEIEELIANSQVRTYTAGTVLCRENAIEDRFYMILEGEVEVTKNINNSEARLLKTLSPGDFFGEMGAMASDQRRTATVVATSPMKALRLTTHQLRRIADESPDITDRLRTAIADREQRLL